MNIPATQRKNRRLGPRRMPRGRVKVTCRKGTLDLGVNLAVAVLDLSETGLCLLVSQCLEKNTDVSLSLESVNHRRPLQYAGTVTWTLPAEHGAFRTGIMLTKRMQYAEFVRMT